METKYKLLKQAGLINLSKTNGIYYGVITSFDPDLGTPLKSTPIQFDLTHLQKRISLLQEHIDSISLLIQDLQALP